MKQSFLLRLTLAFLVSLLFSSATIAQTTHEKYASWCELGGRKVTVGGSQSTTTVQQSMGACTVTVYNPGTLTPAAICSDRLGPSCTPKANPFTADANGRFSFYAAVGRYDLQVTGGTSPNTFPSPLVTSDIVVASSVVAGMTGTVDTNQVVFGAALNVLTGSSALTFNPGSTIFNVNGLIQQSGVAVLTTTAAQTVLNKDLTSSTNTLGRVVMSLSGDGTGDIYYRNGGGLLTRLPIGSAGEVLTVSAGIPDWMPASAGTSPPFTDTTAIVKGSADATKLLRWEIDGFTSSTTRVITPPDADINLAATNISNSWSDGVKQTFNPNASNAGFNVGAHTTDPSLPVNGDCYYNSSANEFRCRINGAWIALSSGGGGGGGSPGGSNGNWQYRVNASTFGGIVGTSIGANGELGMSPSARSGVTPGAVFNQVTPADTTMIADVEARLMIFGSGATRQWTAGGGTFAEQSEYAFLAPTYAFTSGDSISETATLMVSNAPQAGTNATLPLAYAVWVKAGMSKFVGSIRGDSFTDFLEIATPANPPSNYGRLYLSSSTGDLACIDDAGGNCLPSGGGGGIAIGDAVGASNVGSVLFVGAGNLLAEDPTAFFYNATDNRLGIGTGTLATAALTLQISGATGDMVVFRNSGSAATGAISLTNSTVTLSVTTASDSLNLAVQASATPIQSIAATGETVITPILRTSAAAPPVFNIITPADNLSADTTEATLVRFGGNSSGAAVTRVIPGSRPTQREFLFIAPDYSINVTTAATVAISGAPTGGTITNRYALFVQAGDVKVVSNVDVDTALNVDGAFTAPSTATVGTLFVDTQIDAVTPAGSALVAFALTPGAYADAAAEIVDVFWDLSRTSNFTNGGAIANQRSIRVLAPTFDADAGGRTLTKAATMAIGGAPIASTNVTITNGFALSIESGNVGLGTASSAATNLRFFNATNANILTVSAGVTSTSYTWTFPLAAPGSTQCLQMDSSGTVTTTGSACGGGGSSPPFVDTTSIVEGSADNTKEIRFEVDGLTTATVRVLTPPDADITIAGANFANAWGDGIKQTFNPNDTTAGINVGENNAEPSSPADGDIFYDGDGEQLKARINGAWVALGAGGAGCSVAGVQGDYQVNNGAGGCAAGVIVQGTNGRVIASPTLVTGGSLPYWSIVTPADADLATNTNAVGIYFGGDGAGNARTRNFVDGTTYALQEEYVFVQPTYAYDGATIATIACTVCVRAAPVAGSGATLTDSFALYTQSGKVSFNASGTVNHGVNFGTLTHAFGQSGNVRIYMHQFGGTDPVITWTTGSVDMYAQATSAGGFIGTFTSHAMRIAAAQAEVARATTGKSWLVNTTTENANLYVVSNSTSRVALRADSAANASVEVFTLNLTPDDTSTVAPYAAWASNSNGAVATGFGSRLSFFLESNTTNDRTAGSLTWFWADATDASRTAYVSIGTVANGGSLTDRVVIGGGATFSAIWNGNGVTNTSPIAEAFLSATGGSGTDKIGTTQVLTGGPSTGTGTPGQAVISFTTQSATTGTTANALDAGRYPIAPTQFTVSTTGTVANTTTETTVIGTIPAGDNVIGAGVLRPGRSVTIFLDGHVAVTGTPNLTIRFKTDAGTLVTKTFTAFAPVGTAEFHCRFVLTGRTFGSSGTVFTQGECKAVGTAGAEINATGTNTATNTVDMTANRTLDVSAQWSAASASNTISITNIVSRWDN